MACPPFLFASAIRRPFSITMGSVRGVRSNGMARVWGSLLAFALLICLIAPAWGAADMAVSRPNAGTGPTIVNVYPFGTQRPKPMKTCDFPHETIPHTIKDPHSKALEPDCLCPRASDYDTASCAGSFNFAICCHQSNRVLWVIRSSMRKGKEG